MSDKYNDEIVEMEDGDEILETQESTDVDVTHDTASEYTEPVETTGEAEKDEAPQADEKTAAFIDLITAPDYVVVNRNLGLWASKRGRNHNTWLFNQAVNTFLETYPEVKGIHMPSGMSADLEDVHGIALRNSPVHITRRQAGDDTWHFDVEQDKETE